MQTANTQDYCTCTTNQNVHTEINRPRKSQFCDHCHKMIEGSNQPFEFLQAEKRVEQRNK